MSIKSKLGHGLVLCAAFVCSSAHGQQTVETKACRAKYQATLDDLQTAQSAAPASAEKVLGEALMAVLRAKMSVELAPWAADQNALNQFCTADAMVSLDAMLRACYDHGWLLTPEQQKAADAKALADYAASLKATAQGLASISHNIATAK